MADRTRGSYRGRAYSRKSRRPGKKTVKVRGHCRKGPVSRLAASLKSRAESVKWGW